MNTSPLHKLFWLWIPLVFIALQIVIEFTLPRQMLSNMHSESGPHEIAQFVIMLIAYVWSIRILIQKPWKISPWLALWVGIAALGTLYVAGEEMSWGQHILNWSTPEYWQNINDQGETNFHNTSSWLDQKPRLLLLVGSIVGGILIPLLLRFKPAIVPPQFTIIYPPAALGLTAALALGVNLTDKIFEATTLNGNPFFVRGSEVEELFLFYFVLMYLVVLRKRVQEQRP